MKSPGGTLYHWVPLFERFNVDIALESDGHVLKRTVPIRDGQLDPDGVVYIGEGGLGVEQRTPDMSRWYLQPPGMARAVNHVQALRVTPGAIHYSAILENGEVADTHTFRPRRRGHHADPTEQIVTRPIGPPVTPREPPLTSMFQCSTSPHDGVSLLALLFVLACLLPRSRPRNP